MKLLDIGAGAGLFVDEATQYGFNARGIESGEQWCAYAQQRFGVRMMHGDINDVARMPAASVRACTAWDVLEHIRDPVVALAAVHRVLAADGVFACSVPVVDSIAARCMRRRWHGYVPSHCTYFTRVTLLDMLTRAGFSIVHTRWYVRYFSLRYLLSRLGMTARTPFQSLVIPVQICDTMEVYCKKS